MQKARSCSHAGSEEVPLKDTKAFGDLVTMDHKVNIDKGDGCPVFNDEAGKGKRMLVILDYFTQWVQAYPVPSKDYELCLDKILQFFGPEYHPCYDGPGGVRKRPQRCILTTQPSSKQPSRACIGLQTPARLTESKPTVLLRGRSEG